ncbi:MAG TPA: hypothetical protein DCP69_11045 [Candidatus Omnitrophica bacterium]|nr:hypothetical protein [Candidatus Omnitrophota bacterium]
MKNKPGMMKIEPPPSQSMGEVLCAQALMKEPLHTHLATWEYSSGEDRIWATLMRPVNCQKALVAMQRVGTFSVHELAQYLRWLPSLNAEWCLARLALALWREGILAAVDGPPSDLENAAWKLLGLNTKIPNYLKLPHVLEDPKNLEGPF